MFAAISDRRVTRAARGPKVISDLKVRREIPDRLDRRGHRAISGLKVLEVFRASPDRPDRPGLWDRKA